MSGIRTAASTRGIFLSVILTGTALAEDVKVEYHGAGWVQMGRVEKSYTTPSHSSNNYNKNLVANSGAVLNTGIKLDENWTGGFGMGAIMVQLARGSKAQASIWYPFVVPFVSDAWLAYGRPLGTSGSLQLTLGSFSYNYNPDVKNLGLYLMKGYVYPGGLVSGFGNLNGAMVRLKTGGFQNDLILNSETEDKPLYDFSLADVISYKLAPGLELGAGVNLYRLIPQKSDATSPGKGCDQDKDLGPYAKWGQRDACFIVGDSIGFDTAQGRIVYEDTTLVSLAGTKVMMRLRLDPKAWFGVGPFGKDDFVLYGEATILGLKNYKIYYADIKRRIPVMVGLSLPTLDLFSLSMEVEYYASKNSSDNLGAQNGSPVPAVDLEVDNARDDWKWSVNASKVFFGHMQFALQVANDHLRLGGYHDLATGVETLTTPKDWYWTGKLAFFF